MSVSGRPLGRGPEDQSQATCDPLDWLKRVDHRSLPHMSCDLRISLTIKCSKSNSDVIRVLGYPRKHGRPATGTKTSPGAGRRLIFGYQIFSRNYTESFKRNLHWRKTPSRWLLDRGDSDKA